MLPRWRVERYGCIVAVSQLSDEVGERRLMPNGV